MTVQQECKSLLDAVNRKHWQRAERLAKSIDATLTESNYEEEWLSVATLNWMSETELPQFRKALQHLIEITRKRKIRKIEAVI